MNQDQAAFVKAQRSLTTKQTKKKDVPTLKEALGIDRPLFVFRNHEDKEIPVRLRQPGLIEVAELMDAYEPMTRQMNMNAAHLNTFLDVFFGFVIDQAEVDITKEDCRRFFRQTSGEDFAMYLHMFITGQPIDPKKE